MKLFLYFLFILCYGVLVVSPSSTQAHSKVVYMNPEYIRNARILTARAGKRQPYTTSGSGELLLPIAENVTVRLSYTFKGMKVNWTQNFCKIFEFQWVRSFVQESIVPPIPRCPWPAGNYSFVNMELPPKNFPLPMTKGKYNPGLDFFLTGTDIYILRMTSTIEIH